VGKALQETLQDSRVPEVVCWDTMAVVVVECWMGEVAAGGAAAAAAAAVGPAAMAVMATASHPVMKVKQQQRMHTAGIQRSQQQGGSQG
jgi:hypothetical protein